nr:hypothetical protein [Tanacetum cinerariifolium]
MTLGKIDVSFSQIETKLLANESWSQQALNTTHHPFASLGHSWHDVDNPRVLSTAHVGDNEVIFIGFELKSFMSVLRGIIPFGGGFYLATKDGNALGDGIPNTRLVLDGNATICFQMLRANGDQTPQVFALENLGTKYILFSPCLFIGIKFRVYLLALPYDGLQTRKEMCLTSEMKNRDLEFVKASHGIRDSLAGITGMVEMSINDLPQGSELAKNLKRVKSSSEDLNKFKKPSGLAQMATKGNLGEVVVRGLGFKPRRGGFPSGAKNEWGLSPKAKVRVLHTAQLDVTVSSNH